jgi:uncharacterized protein YjbI with pentapeptide repeats
VEFTKNYYYQEKFAKKALTDETLDGIKFEECEFHDCTFLDCKFIRCRFINCKFTGCILSAAPLTDSRFVETVFTGSKAIGLDWTKAQHLEGISFDKCQINYSNFRMLKLKKIKMSGCEAKEADFTEADLSGGDFSNTDFEKSIFFHTNISGADFKGARNYFIDARVNILKKAKFSLPEALALLDGLDVVIE